MNFTPCFSLPGGGEWLLIIFVGLFLFVSPIAAIYYYSKTTLLKKEIESLKAEKDSYLNRLLEKNV